MKFNKSKIINYLKQTLFVCTILFISTFLQIYWSMGEYSDEISSGCLDCSFVSDSYFISLITSLLLTIFFHFVFLLKNKYFKLLLQFLLLNSVWLFWNYSIFVERVSSWSTFLLNEEIINTIYLSLFPVLLLSISTLLIINYKGIR